MRPNTQGAQSASSRIHRIGSYDNGKLNYSPDEHIFPTSAKSSRLKEEVKNFLDPNILSLRKSDWNISSSIDPPNTYNAKKNISNIKFGIIDGKVPRYKPKILIKGCNELRDNYKGNII